MQILRQHFQPRGYEDDHADSVKTGRRIFVIEDDVDLTFVMDRILRMIDPRVQIDWATSAEEARARLNTKAKHDNDSPYDLIIADIFLEGSETGLDLWRFFSSRYPTVPMIITSAIPVDKFLAAKENAKPFPPFLAKPFSVEECKKLIESILLKHGKDPPHILA